MSFDESAIRSKAAAIMGHGEQVAAATGMRVRAGTVIIFDSSKQEALVQLDIDTDAPVLVGTGAHQLTPGDQVEVLDEVGSMRVLSVGVPLPGIPLGVFTPTPLAAVENVDYINELTLWGDSYVGGGGVGSAVASYTWGDPSGCGHPYALEDFVFSGLALDASRARGSFGAYLYAFVSQVMMSAKWGLTYPFNPGVGPYLSRHGAHIFRIGVNDANTMGDPTAEGGRALKLWSHSVRSATAWTRLGAYFPATQAFGGANLAGVVYTGSWTRQPPLGQTASYGNGGADPFGSSVGPGPAGYAAHTVGDSAVLHVPADYPGSDVWLFLTGEVGARGGTVRLQWSEGAVTRQKSLVTNDVVRNPLVRAAPAVTGGATCAVKVPLPATGAAQTITLTITAMGAGYADGLVSAGVFPRVLLLGWGIGAENPLLCEWGGIPVLKYWTGDTLGAPSILWPASPQGNGGQGGAVTTRTGAQAGDSWVPAYDGETAAVATTFDPPGSVVVQPMTEFNGATMPELFRDNIHPNPAGNEAIGRMLLKGLNTIALDPRNLRSMPAFASRGTL